MTGPVPAGLPLPGAEAVSPDRPGGLGVVPAAFEQARRHLAGLVLADPAAAPPLALTLAPGAEGTGWDGGGPPVARGAGRSPIAGAQAALRAGTLSAREMVAEALARLAATESLGAAVSVDPEAVLAEAGRCDAEAARGCWRGPLHGVPVTVKDIIHVEGHPTRAGSLAYERSGVADAAAVGRLRAAGALVLGKVATHEFALGVTTPQCRNPYDPERIAGGSSGGSAVAVATGVGLGSVGTDTRASLRVPAALCGVVGFKPTYGRVPTEGIVPLGWTLDHIGPIARSVADAWLLLEVMAGEPVTAPGGGPGPAGVPGLRVGVVTAVLAAADPAVARAVERQLGALERLGCRLVDSPFPALEDLRLANDIGLLISRSEAATFHRGAGTDLSLCLPEVREQLTLGLGVSAADYLDAQRQRAVLAGRSAAAFREVDVLAGPTTPITAPRRDDYERFLMQLSIATILWSLVGAPALSMPAGIDGRGLPIGLQLCAPPGADRLLAAVGATLEGAHDPRHSTG